MFLAAPASDPVVRELALAWSNRLEGEYLIEPLAHDSREILAARLSELEMCFSGNYDIATLSDSVAEMLAPYRSQRPPEPQTYIHVLRLTVTAPVWAAVEAIKRVGMGLRPKNEFFPLPAQLRAIAWSVAAPFQAERLMIGKVLRALPPRREESAAERQRVASRILDELRNRGGFQGLAPISSKAGSGSSAVSPVVSRTNGLSLNLPEF